MLGTHHLNLRNNMQFNKYIRKPFAVEAIEITEENMAELAKLVGELRTKNGITSITLDRRIVPNVSRAYVGWFMTRLGDNYRCYSPKVFTDQFIDFEPVKSFVFDDIQDEFDATPPHGLARPEVNITFTDPA